MQQTREQYSLVLTSRLPMQWRIPTVCGVRPSRRVTCPSVGPDALTSRSSSMAVYTFG